MQKTQFRFFKFLLCMAVVTGMASAGALVANAATTIYSHTGLWDSRNVHNDQWIASTFVTDGATSGTYDLTVSQSLFGLTSFSPSFTQDANSFFARLYSGSGSNTLAL
jgi:hypothetical protein